MSPSSDSPRRCPVGAQPLFTDAFYVDVVSNFDSLRAEGTVIAAQIAEDASGWLVLGYDEVHEVLTNGDGLWTTDSGRWHGWPVTGDRPPLAVIDMALGESPRFASSAVQRDLAVPLERALGELHPERTIQWISQIADEQVEVFAGRYSGAAELMADYVQWLPTRIMMGLLGMDQRYSAGVSNALGDLREPEHAERGSRKLDHFLDKLVTEKRAEFGPDLVSWLIAHGPDLTPQEIHVQTRRLLTTGLAATEALMGNTLLAMLTDPELRRAAQQESGGMGEVTTQVLQRLLPRTELLARIATRDTRLGDVDISAGDLVVVSLAAASADPRASVTMSGYEIAWGLGDHACPMPARDLALRIVHTSVERLFHHLPDLMLNAPARDRHTLPVSFTRVREMLVEGEPTYLPDPIFTTAPPTPAGHQPLWAGPDPQAVMMEALGEYVVFDKPYPHPLPAELAPWHGYTRLGGHIIYVVYDDGSLGPSPSPQDLANNMCPASVKTVLRVGWRAIEGYVVCELPWDPWNGIVTPEEDYER
ncbi:cytochrome P450 (plasmid) [Actinacidiphila glaucinigra]|uniref:hypothetical protein n=1 Tax=Actinacidiphila glaucinigra TaxID=235986 RepID=UPI002DD82487|nr:hypothetical protein [Actinacidiphila glaucinigra]WSD65900.1 cytochrome P450 [Actinacidiphila glaucinigra]